jgi:hypothetical protein
MMVVKEEEEEKREDERKEVRDSRTDAKERRISRVVRVGGWQ